MKITQLKSDKTEYHVKAIIYEKEITKLIDDKLDKIAKTAKMNGFRVGKVPTEILKKKSPSIRIDITRNKINIIIDDIIKKNNLNIVTAPAIEDLINEEGKDLEFTLKFELLPEITLPEFKKISIEKPKFDISKKDIDDQIKKLADFSKTYDEKSKTKAKEGDHVTIDAVGYIDGKAFDGGKLDAHKLVLGGKSFIPGFEDQLIGCKTGDNITVKVTLPKDYHAENLAAKPSEFKVKVIAVHKEQVVKIDNKFAKRFNCDTVAKLKQQVLKNIESSYDEPIHVMMKMKLFDTLENMLKFNVPKSLLEREKDTLKKETTQVGYEAPSIKGKSDREKEAYFNKLASRRVRIALMLAEYVKKNNLQIQEDDIREAIIATAKNYPGQEKEVIEFYQKDRGALESLKGLILEEKAVREIFDKEVILSEKTYSKDKLEKLLEKETDK